MSPDVKPFFASHCKVEGKKYDKHSRTFLSMSSIIFCQVDSPVILTVGHPIKSAVRFEVGPVDLGSLAQQRQEL